MNLTNTSTLLSLGLFCFVTASAPAQDWPQWRGPNRDAKAAAFNAPATWPAQLEKKWTVTVGDGVATPALVGGKLFVFARQGGNEVVLCLNASTGAEEWRDEYATEGAAGPASRFSGPRSSPTVVDGKVVTFGVRGVLSCLEASTGKLLWRKNDYPEAWPRFFTSASPIVIGDQCLAQVGAPEAGGIVAYELNDGTVKWKWEGDGPAYASPIACTIAGSQEIVTLTANKIVGVNVADGTLAWETPFVPERRAYNAATPIAQGDTVIYSGAGRGTTAVKLVRKGTAVTAEQLWSNPEVAVQFNTPVLKDRLIYGISDKGDLFCLNGATGKTAWTQPSGDRSGYGSVVDAGSVLLALTPESNLIVLTPTEQKYTEVANIKVAETPTYAYPIAAAKSIFIKDKDSVTLWTVD